MEKFLVCFCSEWLRKAWNETTKIAKKFNSQITVLSVVPKVCILEIGVDCATVVSISKAELEGNLKKAEEILNEKGGERTLFGSVTQKVAANLGCSVLII